MKKWLKETWLWGRAILGLIGLIIIVFWIVFGSCSACGQEVPEFFIPVPATSEPLPGLVDVQHVSVTSYDGINFDELDYILRSQETGFYPNFGWTGQYYVTGATHGVVHRDDYNINNSISQGLLDNNSKNIPTPSSLALLSAGLLLIARRWRLDY